MEDNFSVRDIRAKRYWNQFKFTEKIKEDIKKHKKGEIKTFPTYLQYMEEFNIISKKKIKDLILKQLGKEELDYLENYWRDFMKKQYSREGWIKKEKIGNYAERLVKKQLEKEGWEVIKIHPYQNEEKERGWLKFNWDVLKNKDEKICNLLYKLRRWEGVHLPDFVCFNENKVKFVEVKSGRIVKWRDKQAKGIDRLEEMGYVVEIIKPEFFENEVDKLLEEK